MGVGLGISALIIAILGFFIPIVTIYVIWLSLFLATLAVIFRNYTYSVATLVLSAMNLVFFSPYTWLVLIANESVEGGSKLFLPLTVALFAAPFAVMIIQALSGSVKIFTNQRKDTEVHSVSDVTSSKKTEASKLPGILGALPVKVILIISSVIIVFLLGYQVNSIGVFSSDDKTSSVTANDHSSADKLEQSHKQHQKELGGKLQTTNSKESIQLTQSVSIREVQELLEHSGYDPGVIDGVAGEKTVAAIKGYQAENGLPVNGLLSQELLLSLKSTPKNGNWLAFRGSRGYIEDPLNIYVDIKKKCGAYSVAMRGKKGILPCPHILKHGYIRECLALPQKSKARSTLVLYDSPDTMKQTGVVEEGESVTLIARQLITVPIPVKVTATRDAHTYPPWLYPGWPKSKGDNFQLRPGEIIHWITGIGEGANVYYRKDGLIQVGFLPATNWNEEILPIIDIPGETRPVQIDWIKIKTVDGKKGWTPTQQVNVFLGGCS